MFDPIYEFTKDGFSNFWLITFVLANVVMYFLSIAHFSYKYITMGTPHWITPLCWVIDRTSPECDRGWWNTTFEGARSPVLAAFLDFTLGTIAQSIASGFILIILIAAINWLWLPLVIISGYAAFLRGGRAIVSLKRSLNDHIKDKNAHK